MNCLTSLFVNLVIFTGSTGATPIAYGPYLGQTPPGSTAKIFAPGLICRSDRHESCGSISPDGKYLFFSSRDDIYWVDVKAFLPDPNELIMNTVQGQ